MGNVITRRSASSASVAYGPWAEGLLARGTLEHIGLTLTDVPDAMLATLGKLPRLRNVDLSSARQLTGAGVVALGVVLTALFVAVEGAASSLIVTQLGMPSASGPIVAGTAVAIGFQPLRARVERGVQSAMLKLLPPEAVAEELLWMC